ncbi:MAG: hypothetical protein IKZ97_07270 [Butyrivibrio sp.]|nr:hypothetical protein [Butyrivibrio sp.]
MLICTECGKIFDEDEAKVVHDHVGDFWGAPAYQDFLECPDCGSDMLEDYREEEEDEEDDG